MTPHEDDHKIVVGIRIKTDYELSTIIIVPMWPCPIKTAHFFVDICLCLYSIFFENYTTMLFSHLGLII